MRMRSPLTVAGTAADRESQVSVLRSRLSPKASARLVSTRKSGGRLFHTAAMPVGTRRRWTNHTTCCSWRLYVLAAKTWFIPDRRIERTLKSG